MDFVDAEEEKRIKELRKKGYHPFPGLIKPAHTSGSSAFDFQKSRFILIQGCTVENMFSISLGKDSSIILRDHKQLIRTKDLDQYEFVIKLAYIISFGDEIKVDNFYTTLEDLISYSFGQWR